MLKKLIIPAVAGAAALHSGAAAQQAAPSATMFGAREAVESIDISPDGTKLVYLAPAAGASSVALVGDLAGGKPAVVATSSGKPDRLSWCRFVSNSRIICRAYALIDNKGVLIPFGRLFSMDANGGDMKELGQSLSYFDSRIRQFDGSILDWMPEDNNAVLMARDYIPEEGRIGTRLVRQKDGLGVDRIDVRTLKATPVEPVSRTASDFMTDGRGKVRIREIQNRRAGASDQLMAQTISFSYRRTGRSDWEDFSTYNMMNREGTYPVAIDASLNAAYALRKLNGRFALYRVKLDGSMATELVYANPRVDVDNVVRIGRGGRVIGVTFAEEARSTVYFDPEYAKLAKSLSKAIPNLPLVRFAGSSNDNNKLLIFAGSDSDPGRYYVYDKKARALNEVMLARPQLENMKLATMKPVTYAAADGVQIPAYLSVPPGKDPKNLPAIVLPHGGPTARDEWGFDWLTQFLVAQGYAVLQPNYRGSAGYGDEWMKQNGFKGWRTSVGDVTAAAKWMVGQGIADPKRLAIVGWSYGGYAALQSAVTEPQLFKAVVAVAPVTDLAMLKLKARGFTNSELVEEFVGSGPHVREGSPLQNAERISAPVLMFHGERDINVDVDQARAMDRALRGRNARSELVVFPGLEHSLEDSAARATMLQRIAGFLGQATGNAAGSQ
ncbi:MAG TPA: S9 family peptidase [Allosphingosinicella sp.]|jgi:dienelactone hydrolase